MTPSQTTTTFDSTHWCDYVRGTIEPDIVRRLEEQLASSGSASRTVELFRRVVDLAEADRILEVPDYAVRIAKAVGGLSRAAEPGQESSGVGYKLASMFRFVPFRVTFDSLQATPAGTRAPSSPHQRNLSFEAADFSIHVKLEQETNPYSQVVVGQLLHHEPRLRPVPDAPVLVLSKSRVVARSLTSRYGEFQAVGLPPDPLNLCLLVGREDCIDIPLGDFHEDA